MRTDVLLEAVDVVHQVADGLEAFGLAELDVAALFEVAGELDHVEGVDAEGLERGIFGDGFGVDVQFVVHNLLHGIDVCHLRSFLGDRAHASVPRNAAVRTF